jgi:hypothetical protein
MVSKRNKDKHVQTASVNWITKLAEEVNLPFPPKGEEWLTLTEVAEKLNRGLTAATNVLKRAGAEKKRFSHIGIDGRRVTLVHYRIK